MPAPGSPVQAYTAGLTLGYQTSAATITKDGSALFLLSHYYYRCANDPSFSSGEFGAVIVKTVPDATAVLTTQQISPRLTATLGQLRRRTPRPTTWLTVSATATAAEALPAEPTPISLMSKSTAAAMAGTYRLAYVTRNSMHFDGACVLLAGDPEVWLLDTASTTHQFYNLSNNHAPLVDDDRGISRRARSRW